MNKKYIVRKNEEIQSIIKKSPAEEEISGEIETI